MDFSLITSDLFIGTTPSKHDYDLLRELGVKLVINMRWEYRLQKDEHPDAFELLWLPSFDTPFIPISIQYLVCGAQAAMETISEGGKVYAHCVAGRHRSVAMGACILIAQGLKPQAAMDLIQSKRPIADPRAYYIRPRILRFAKEWEKIQSGENANEK